MLAQLICNGLVAGSAYSLIAIGYTMIYGVGRLINFAHGELYMCSAFCFYAFYILLDLNLYIAFVLSAAAGCVMGIILERIAYRPFKNYSRLVPLISTIGASTFLKALVVLIFGIQTKSLLKDSSYQQAIDIFNVTITPVQLYTMIISVFAMLILGVILKRTTMGKAIRATSEDEKSARHVGIDTNAVTSITFAIGGCLAAVAGIMVGYDQNIHPNMGILAGFKGFTAAVLGGIGNIPGAVIGGFIIGLVEHIGAGYISSIYKDSFSFIILLLVLISRPRGLMGEK
jgi:branched-chain amino acid transport system permease protein